MMTKMTAKTVVIDADWICFLAAAAVDVQTYTFTNEDKSVVFNTRTIELAKKYCERKGLDYNAFTSTKERNLVDDYLNQAKYILIGKVNKLKKDVGADKVLMVIGGKTNFRDRLPLFSRYKDRDGSYRPACLQEVREMCKELFHTQTSEDCEADDLISMYQYMGRLDQSYIVVTEDKDAKQTPGFLYNPRRLEIRDCNGFGSLELVTKVSAKGSKNYKIEGYGRLWFYTQVLLGDPVDTYKPFSKGMTDYSVYNLLKDCKTDLDCWTIVANKYKEAFGALKSWTSWEGIEIKGTWIDILQTYVDVVHMRRYPDDRIVVEKVLKKYEII